MAISDEMRGIPIEYLIASPLMAAARSQIALAEAMTEFIMKIGFEKDKTKLIEFDLERPVQMPEGGVEKQTIHVEAPLLGIVPIPALLIDDVSINFSLEIHSHSESKSSTDASVKAEASGGWGFGNFSMSASVSTHRENTRSTDKTAKYDFHVQARQQPPTEGMSKLSDIFASCIEPIPAAGGK